MKNLLSFVLVATLSIAAAHGKPRNARRNSGAEAVKFGAKAGVNFANVWQGTKESHFITRLGADLFGEYPLNNTLGIRASLGYSGQGGSDEDSSTKKIMAEALLDYITLSSTFRFYLQEDKNSCFFIGPQIGYLMSAKLQLYDGKGDKYGEPVDLVGENRPGSPDDPELSRVDFGILLGGDYEFDPGIILGVSSSIGFGDLNKDLPNNDSCYNYAFRIALGYNFATLL